MKSTIIYLIRHSEQLRDYNDIEMTQQENEKIILSVEGEKKAKKLSQHSELTNLHEIWSSSYSRAVGTAKYIADRNHLKIKIDNRLNERRVRRFSRIANIGYNKKISIYYRTNINAYP